MMTELSSVDIGQDSVGIETAPPAQPAPLPDTYPFDTEGALCREFLLEQGYCCGNGCRNCPYDEE